MFNGNCISCIRSKFRRRENNGGDKVKSAEDGYRHTPIIFCLQCFQPFHIALPAGFWLKTQAERGFSTLLSFQLPQRIICFGNTDDAFDPNTSSVYPQCMVCSAPVHHLFQTAALSIPPPLFFCTRCTSHAARDGHVVLHEMCISCNESLLDKICMAGCSIMKGWYVSDERYSV